jgi:hypothetical protein
MKYKTSKQRRPLLRVEIEEAQAKSRSAAEAARILGCSYTTFKKYARMYGIHKTNKPGKGISKTHVMDRSYPIEEILAGKHPSYSVKKLKYRLIKLGYLPEACQLCGFKEKRITDFRAPLLLIFNDGDSTNHRLENLRILCYNCAFLTVGELNRLSQRSTLFKIDNTGVPGGNVGSLTEEEMAKAIDEAKQELRDEHSVLHSEEYPSLGT